MNHSINSYLGLLKMQIIGLRNHFVSKGIFTGCCANLHLSCFHIMILVNSWPDGLEQLPPMPGKSLCLRRQNRSFVCNSFMKVHKGNFPHCELLLSEQHFPWKTMTHYSISKQTKNMQKHFFRSLTICAQKGKVPLQIKLYIFLMFFSCH